MRATCTGKATSLIRLSVSKRIAASFAVVAWTVVSEPGMARDHRLNEVQRLAAADFAHDDPVGPHPQRIDEQVADRDAARAVWLGRLGFKVDRVRLVKLQLGAVFDDHDPLVFRDFGRECVEERSFSAARAAGDDHVLMQQHRTGSKTPCPRPTCCPTSPATTN